jgi:hypothetical protein
MSNTETKKDLATASLNASLFLFSVHAMSSIIIMPFVALGWLSA